eukprot:TRINITY_DN8970_c0_g1_i6.p1 TRINITY_DN8970_c0_g1~~TRINITY_DN8970_c0_g1_i6.p1  ORF type:complete len:333 (-),score=68.66 TRINITY_DN8970_c0_g1_i6:567-1565(-)
MGACTEGLDKLCFVTELMEGDLHTLLHSSEIRLSNLQKLSFAIDITQGMAWLHGAKPHRIIHRDLKPYNLLVDENWKVKVCDFGLSCIVDTSFIQDKDVANGSALWMAPEVLMGQPLNEKLDVYSFGLILWEIFTRTTPYAEYRNVTEFRKAICKDGVRPPMNKPSLPSALAPIIQQCWAHLPSERPSFVTVLDMLKDSAVDLELAPSCATAAALWQRNFAGLTQVTYDALVQVLQGYFGFKVQGKSNPLKCFRALVSHEKKQGSDSTAMVNIHQLGLVLSWFGPLDGLPDEPPGWTFLDRLHDVASHPWFFGCIDKEDSEEKLRPSFFVKM